MFEIDKAVPPPANLTRKKYPFHTLSVGDSFFVPDGKPVNVGSAAYAHSNTYLGRGKRFAVRRVQGGVRCWRVE